MSPAVAAVKHHYLPVFYLRNWAYDGNIIEFTKFEGHLKAHRRSPKGAGYKVDLYKIAGVESEAEHVFEKKFLMPLDNAAACIMQKFIKSRLHLSEKERLYWSAFLLSIMARCPASVATLKHVWRSFYVDMEQKIEAESIRLGVSLADNADRSRISAEEACKASLQQIKMAIVQPEVCRLLASMHWHVRRFDENCFPLLTSDRPILMTNGLDVPRGQLVIPMSPSLAFFAHRDAGYAEYILREESHYLGEQINKWVVSQAVSHVYAQNEAQRCLVEKYMSTKSRTLYVDYRKQDQIV